MRAVNPAATAERWHRTADGASPASRPFPTMPGHTARWARWPSGCRVKPGQRPAPTLASTSRRQRRRSCTSSTHRRRSTIRSSRQQFRRRFDAALLLVGSSRHDRMGRIRFSAGDRGARRRSLLVRRRNDRRALPRAGLVASSLSRRRRLEAGEPTPSGLGTSKDQFNAASFSPVTTTRVAFGGSIAAEVVGRDLRMEGAVGFRRTPPPE